LEPTRKQPAIAKLLDEARDCGVVRIDIDADAVIIGKEDEDLSDELRRAFALDSAHVIEFATDLDNDEVAVGLANYAAENIRNNLRSHDHIAVAGGRTIARLCKAIVNKPVNVHDVVITPLGGRLWTGHLWKAPSRLGKHFEQPFNPDDCALILARGIYAGSQPAITFSQVSHPLFANSEAEATAIIEKNCAFRPHSGWNWDLAAPSQAFVGVGMVTIATHHRLAEWLDSSDNTLSRSQLAAIASAMETAQLAGLPAFGDVANRLFVSLPLPADLPRDSSGRAALLKTIQTLDDTLLEINRRSVVMGWDHLRTSVAVTAIAGGTLAAPKTQAIWTLLLTSLLFERNVKFGLLNSITTDIDSAQLLISAREHLEQLGDGTKSWYVAALQLLFPKDSASSAR
jgi:hypothetical protein